MKNYHKLNTMNVKIEKTQIILDECYADLESFRKDIYKEISVAVQFGIELKFKETEEKIKQY